MGAAYLFFLYQTLAHRSWVSGGLAIIILAAMLLSKTSGILWLVYAGLLPLLIITENNKTLRQIIHAFKAESLRLYLTILAIALIAKAIAFLLIPGEFDAVEANSFQKGLVRNLGEVLEFPIVAWIENLKFYGTVLFLDLFYGVVPLFGLSLMAIIWLWMNKSLLFWRYLTLIGFFFASFLPLIIAAKGQAVRYFGMGLYFFYIPAAIALSMFWEKSSLRYKRGMGLLLLFFIIWWKVFFSWIPLIQWGQTELALKETPPGWANGAGIMEMIENLSRLPPGVLMVDSQWGFPLTAVQIFYKYYPQLDVWHINAENLENLRQIYQQSTHGNQHLYFVVDSRAPGERLWIDKIINTDLLCTPKTVIQKQYQDQVFKRTALVICQAKAIPSSIKIVR